MQVCSQEWSEPISAWIDGEATEEERLRVEAHLARCPRCADAAGTVRALGIALRASADEEVTLHVTARARALSSPRRARWPWVAVAAVAIAAAAVLAVGARSRPLDDALSQELVAHHLRGFARARPCELESSDPAAVRAWVEQRLGYEVEVPTPEGAELIGARACSLDGRATAALLYRYDGEAMTVFVPPPGSDAVTAATRFASSGARCTRGPIGERICVSSDEQSAFAVANLPEPRMLSVFPR